MLNWTEMGQIKAEIGDFDIAMRLLEAEIGNSHIEMSQLEAYLGLIRG